MTERFWVIDVEGNGASPPEIIELAIVEVSDWMLTDRCLHWFLRPQASISASATAIHGITDADVASAPSIGEIGDDLTEALEGVPIVGHHVRTEVDALSRSLLNWSPLSAIDTIKLTKLLRPGLKSYGLQSVGIALCLADQAGRRSGRGHHSALYDATLTALIFVDLLSDLTAARREAVLRECDLLDPAQKAFL